MSNNQLNEFFRLLAEDVTLREEFEEVNVSAGSIVTLAAKHGLFFTAEELRTQVGSLSDDEWSDAARRFDGHHSDCYILFLEEAPMSKEALNAFFKKVAGDESLQKKLVEFAAAQGFEFSADELSDSDLDSAAGGLLSTSTLLSRDDKHLDIKVENLDPLVADKWEPLQP